MASVFLSYDREDVGKARSVAHALEKTGHSVWWDRHIRSGAQYTKEIEEALERADAVVVLWSEQSVESAWVRDEAATGRDSGRLVPVLIDKVEPPLGFRQYQTTDLSRWKGRTASTPFQEMISAIAALGGEPRLEPAIAERTVPLSRPRLKILAAAIAALVVAGLLLWEPWGARSSMPVVAVAAASQSNSDQALAQDLFVRLGAAQSGRLGSVQLVREGGGRKPDLILEVSGTQSTANLVLLRGSDRQLLSSMDLAAPPGRNPELMPSLEIAAAATVDCAANALTSLARLPLGALKDYLHACARFNSLYGTEDVYILIPQLGQIVQREPRFIPAWKLLLLSGAHMRSIQTDNAKPSEQWLRTMVGRTKRVEASMPEIRLAELQLLPVTDFPRRISLVDNLRNTHPDDMFVLGARAEQLMLVGRNNEA
ncbi:MAG: toll/interleukin-1 receptor domain-containing protein, partial [Sphingomicrobium sp.]